MKRIKKILMVIFGVLILVILGVYLMRNTLIEYFGEKIGSQKYGAKIDIDDVDLDLFNGTLKIGRLQVTDKNDTMRNIGDIKGINLTVEYKPLLKRLIVVDDLTLGLVEVFTPREVDGSIKYKGKQTEKKSDDMPKFHGNDVKFNSLNIDMSGDNYEKILEGLNIKIVNEYKSEKEKIEKIYIYWDKKLKGESYKVRLKKIEKKYKVVEERIKEEKNPLELLDELNKLNGLINEIDKLVKEVESDKKQFDKDLKVVKGIQKQAFGYIHSEDIFKNLIGWDEKKLKEEINFILNKYLEGYIYKNINFLNELDKNNETPKKMAYDFWVKKISITFKHMNYTLKGGVKDLTSKAGITPNPIRFNLEADDRNIEGKLVGELNQELDSAKIKLNILGLTIDDRMVSENKNLIIIVGSKLDFSYNMSYEEKKINLDGKILLSNLKINPSELGIDPKILKILGDGLKGIDKLIINYKYDGEIKKLVFDTNIGETLSKLIKKVLDQNLKIYEKKAKIIAEEEIKKYMKKLNIEVEKVEELREIMSGSLRELKVLEKNTKSNKDSTSTRNLIEGLGDSLKNLFN